MMVPTQYDWIYQLYVREFGNKLLPTDFYYENGSYYTKFVAIWFAFGLDRQRTILQDVYIMSIT